MDPAEKTARRTNKKKRQEWEQSDVGRKRIQGADAWSSQQNTKAMQQADPDWHGPAAPTPRGLLYDQMGWGTRSEGHRFDQRPLPGLEREDAAPESTHWENLPHHERQRTVRALEAHGTSIEQMHHDLGAQVDQSFIRAHTHGQEPFSQHFYTDHTAPKPGEEASPGYVVHQGAKEMGVPLGVHVAMNAFTSPNTKFSQGKGQNIYYPNDETARSVTRQVQAGIPAKEVTAGVSPRDPSKKNQGYTTNVRKAADAMEQYREGVPVAQWKGRISSTKSGGVVDVPENKQVSPFGEKTGPYHNAWLPGAQDYFVSDVHSGGGGLLPHLGAEKPLRRDAAGNAVRLKEFKGDPRQDHELPNKAFARDKSEREAAIESIPNFHALADHISRRVGYQRGMGSTRQMQAAQWGEEQIQRTEQNPKLALATEQGKYAEPAAKQAEERRPKVDPAQGSFF